MKPIIIGISGAYSGAGKTMLASMILQRLKGWGAIKYTKTAIYCSVTDDIAILSEEGKDTQRLLDSGSEKVLWVQAPQADLGEILPMALDKLYDLEGVLVEGNSAVEFLKPDIVVFVSGDEKEFKEGSENSLRMADVVVYGKKPPKGMPKRSQRFRWDDLQGCIDYVMGLVEKRKKDSRGLGFQDSSG
jgi:molybdopterin-guanine dinucleotide biosynthesis protein